MNDKNTNEAIIISYPSQICFISKRVVMCLYIIRTIEKQKNHFASIIN